MACRVINLLKINTIKVKVSRTYFPKKGKRNMVSFAFCALTLILSATVSSYAEDSSVNYNDESVQKVLQTLGLSKFAQNTPITITSNLVNTVEPSHVSIVIGKAPSPGKSAAAGTKSKNTNKKKRPLRKGRKGRRKLKIPVNRKVDTAKTQSTTDPKAQTITDTKALPKPSGKPSAQKFTWKLNTAPTSSADNKRKIGVAPKNVKPASAVANNGKPSRAIPKSTKSRLRSLSPVVQEPTNLEKVLKQYPNAFVVNAQPFNGPINSKGGGTFMAKVDLPGGKLPANTKINLILLLTINPHIQGAPQMSSSQVKNH